MIQIQRVASVVHKVESLSGDIDQAKQGASTRRRTTRVVQQCLGFLSSPGCSFDKVAIVAVGGENISVDREGHAQGVIQVATAGEGRSGVSAGMAGKRIRNGGDSIVQAIGHVEYLLVFAQRYSGRSDHQGRGVRSLREFRTD